MRRETQPRLFEPGNASLRLPLGIAAAIILLLALYASLSFESDELIARRAIELEAEDVAAKKARHVETALFELSKAISSQRLGEKAPSAIQLVGYGAQGGGEVRFWPASASPLAKPKPHCEPSWFALGKEPPAPPRDAANECFVLLDQLQKVAGQAERQSSRRALLDRCQVPMTASEHVVQAEELVAYLEDGGTADAWWRARFEGLIGNAVLATSQRQYLAERLSVFTSQSAAKEARSRLQRSTMNQSSYFANEIRSLLAAPVEQLPKIEFDEDVLYIGGHTGAGEIYVAAIDPVELLDSLRANDDGDTRFLLVSKPPADPSAERSASLLGRRDLFVSASVTTSRVRWFVWRYRLIIGGLLLCALALAALAVFLERRRFSQLVRVDQLRTEFVGRISHQFRTPLTSISLYAETLEQRDLPPDKAKKYLGTIASAARQLGDLTNRLLNLSRMQQGKYAFAKEPFDVTNLLEEAAARLRSQPRFRMGELRQDFEQPLGTYEGDRGSLGEALDNMLENAAKYTADDGVIVLRAHRHEGALRVIVDDNGPGIAAAERKKVFESYYRVDDRLTQSVAGTGLGLTLVKQIAAAHGGAVWVEDSPLGGARLVVSLPEPKKR